MVGEPEFDLFLSYNRRDAAAVERLAGSLKARGLRVYKDDWYLQPGSHWPTALEQRLGACRGVAVAISGHGIGPWQRREVYLAIQRQEQDADESRPEMPIIPVLLDEAGREHAGLGLISQNVWVENADPRAGDLIAGALSGTAPRDLYDDEHPDPRTLICPYKGLRHFREDDAAFYFGREEETDRLADAVGRHPIVAVVGASGSGKSSLARAGLVPYLRRQTGRDVWQIVTVGHPGNSPFLQLARALLPLWEPERFSEWSKNQQRREAEELARSLRTHGAPRLLEVAAEVLAEEPGTNRLLLLIDQWEELYTHRATDAAAFVHMLLAAADDQALTAVLTMRADFWGDALTQHPELARRLAGDAAVHLATPERENLEAAIVEPARRTLLHVEPALVEALVRDAEGRPGDMPLLEFALFELWREKPRTSRVLSQDLYRRIGGLDQAIVQYAENEVFNRLPPAEQEAVPGVFFHLFQPPEQAGHQSDLRRRARLSELASEGRAVATRLADKRLLTTSRDWEGEDELVEVAHEALLRHWPRLQGYLERWRDAGLMRRRLEADVARWLDRGKDQAYRWPHELVREVAHAIATLEGRWRPGAEAREFLGPIDVQAMLAEIVDDATPHQRRALIGERLEAFADPRPGIGLDEDDLPAIDWVDIPGGEVTIEIRERDTDATSAIARTETRTVAPFQVARFPVTLRQFRRFMAACEADGSLRLPPEAQSAGIDPSAYSPPRPRARHGNHPVDSVSWFDACAFCHWLSIRRGETIRLPTEFEWQQAASGGTAGRHYPWGGDWDPSVEPWRANTVEADLGQATAVGLYPRGASRHGVFDMSGTVWEWCGNKFAEVDELSFEWSNTQQEMQVPRVLRGGSWDYARDFARVGFRVRYFPSIRSNDVGFRVVRSSPS